MMGCIFRQTTRERYILIFDEIEMTWNFGQFLWFITIFEFNRIFMVYNSFENLEWRVIQDLGIE